MPPFGFTLQIQTEFFQAQDRSPYLQGLPSQLQPRAKSRENPDLFPLPILASLTNLLGLSFPDGAEEMILSCLNLGDV